MDRYCSECNSTMTPSLVGYLCPNCGNLQRFYTMTGTQLKAISPPRMGGSEDNKPIVAIEHETKKAIPEAGSSEKLHKKIKKTMKRLMVPELPPPHEVQKMQTTKSLSGDQKYYDLIDSSSGDNKQLTAEASPLPNTSKGISTEDIPSTVEEIQQHVDISKEYELKKKHLPIWVWLLLGLMIFTIVSIALLFVIQS